MRPALLAREKPTSSVTYARDSPCLQSVDKARYCAFSGPVRIGKSSQLLLIGQLLYIAEANLCVECLIAELPRCRTYLVTLWKPLNTRELKRSSAVSAFRPAEVVSVSW